MAGKMFDMSTLVDSGGEDRLVLRCIELQSTADFHSLAWEEKTESGWQKRWEITAVELGGVQPGRRWISDLHDFLPRDSKATIQVAKQIPAKPPMVYSVEYTWEEWKLECGEAAPSRTILKCNSPFDRLRKDADAQ